MRYDSTQFLYLLKGSDAIITKGVQILAENGITDANDNLAFQVGSYPKDKELLNHAKELFEEFKINS